MPRSDQQTFNAEWRRLGISTTPMGEALVALRGQGFLVLQPRRGYPVALLSRQDMQGVFWVMADISAELASLCP